MVGLTETLANIARYRRGLPGAWAVPNARVAAAGELVDVPAFGANPGALRMWMHVPAELGRGAPLVVVLHGCGQTASGYARGAGWLELADRYGFALLLPEQRRSNNAGGCFNWFEPEDVTRGHGEVASIRAMVQHALTTWSLDGARVFATGLSAGGAMVNALLATYPELFAGGAIIAGLPYGAARNTQTALDLMHRGQPRPAREWGDLVRAGSAHAGPWPRIAVWQGGADTTVVPANGADIVRQWLDVRGLAEPDAVAGREGPAAHAAWLDSSGVVAVESFTLPRLGHAVPISAADADAARRCGAPAQHIVEAGLSSSWIMARAWRLTGQMRPTPVAAETKSAAAESVAGVIAKALKAAGLG